MIFAWAPSSSESRIFYAFEHWSSDNFVQNVSNFDPSQMCSYRRWSFWRSIERVSDNCDENILLSFLKPMFESEILCCGLVNSADWPGYFEHCLGQLSLPTVQTNVYPETIIKHFLTKRSEKLQINGGFISKVESVITYKFNFRSFFWHVTLTTFFERWFCLGRI